jgi:hypothetical protein
MELTTSSENVLEYIHISDDVTELVTFDEEYANTCPRSKRTSSTVQTVLYLYKI